MSFDKIVAGDHGQVFELTFIDVDTGTAADISAYSTTIQMVFTDPAGTETAKTATFVTDGTDGKIQYTAESGFINVGGNWHVRGRVTGASAKLSTEAHKFMVLA